MARDPFSNYDSWLEQPYQDEYAAAEREEAEQAMTCTVCNEWRGEELNGEPCANCKENTAMTCTVCDEWIGIDLNGEPCDECFAKAAQEADESKNATDPV